MTRILKAKAFAGVLCLTMIISLFPGMGFTRVVHAEGAETICLGTEGLANPVNRGNDSRSAWNGSYIYYGRYGDSANPVKYRVLSKRTGDFSGTTMLLDCNDLLLTGSFDGTEKKNWADSSLKTWLNGNGFCGDQSSTDGAGFNTPEYEAVAESTKARPAQGDGNGRDTLSFAPLNKDRIFLLDAKEASRPDYGYCNETHYIEARKKRMGSNSDSWWLRSPSADNYKCDGIVDKAGTFGKMESRANSVYVSPAFNVKLSSIILSSLISGSFGQNGAEYKLALLDGRIAVSVSEDKKATLTGGTVTVPYTKTGAYNNREKVYVVFTNGTWDRDTGWSSGAEIKHIETADSTSQSGTLTFRVNDEDAYNILNVWKAYLIVKQDNGTYVSDYAGEPVEIRVTGPEPEPQPEPRPILKSISNATVTGVFNKTATGIAITQDPKVTVDGKTLTEGVDYSLSYANNINVGTATMTITGMGEYTDTKEVTFKILNSKQARDLSNATVEGISDKSFTGKAITQNFTVNLGGRNLKAKKEYTVTYKNNKKVGTAAVTITGKGKIKGKITKTFKIKKADNPLKVKAVTKPATLKAKDLKKKSRTIAVTKVIKITRKGKGKVTYAKVSGDERFKMNKSGKITVKKGTPAGTYPITANVTAAGDGNYNKVTETVTFTVKVS
ncbi:MAG: hypothetical protein IK152_02850 [Lachnospiraceae bacterium]|nr:hypothetical protein [Lachnospiraceae bacterium]